MAHEGENWLQATTIIGRLGIIAVSICVMYTAVSLQGGYFAGRRLADEDGPEQTVVLLFMFFGLAVGILAMQLLSIFGDAIPYTCLVFLIGVLFSTGNDKGTGTFGQSIGEWVDIDADLLLFVFLPPLIFGEAMSLNWYHVRGGFFQSVILAGPGVLISAALMAVLTKMLLPYDWSWTLAMVFGSILSATDPVAVVALLKNVGASAKLTILIVGESLLNDGSAMVLFTIFYNSLNGTTYNAGSITVFFIEAVLGSVVLGVVFGLVTVRWLRSANRPLEEIDVTTQIAITICCAYLCFFTAQYALKMSGVLACCGAGVMLAWLAPPIILNHKSMHNVWSMIEWSLNTLIFLLAGLIIGNRVINRVHAIDFLYLLVLYALLMVVRAVTILCLYPFISRIGHRCSLSEALFMSWAGLRGALGMALALLVEKHCPDQLDDETSRLFFFVGGIAALTLVINATTAKALLYRLGLVSTDSAEKQLVTEQIKKKLRRKMNKVITQMTHEFQFTPDDLEVVRQSCTLLQHVDMDVLYRDTERASMLLADGAPGEYFSVSNTDDTDPQPNHIADGIGAAINNTTNNNNANNNTNPAKRRGSTREHRSHSRSSNHSTNRPRRRSSFRDIITSTTGITTAMHNTENERFDRISRMLSRGGRGNTSLLDTDLLRYIRAVFLEIVRVKYWHSIEVGKLPRLSHSAQFLLYTIEVGLDHASSADTQLEGEECEGAQDWACLEDDLDYKSFAVFFLTIWETYLPRFCGSSWATHWMGRIESRREKRAVYMLTSFIEAHQHAQQKIHAFLCVEDDGAGDAPSPEELKVIAESKRAVELAQRRLQAMDSETVAGIRAKQAARLVLAKEAEMVRNMVQEGLLTPHHAEEFLEEISHDTQRIESERNRMYREHAQRRGKIRWQEKKEEYAERNSFLFSANPFGLSFQSRSSLFSPRNTEVDPSILSTSPARASGSNHHPPSIQSSTAGNNPPQMFASSAGHGDSSLLRSVGAGTISPLFPSVAPAITDPAAASDPQIIPQTLSEPLISSAHTSSTTTPASQPIPIARQKSSSFAAALTETPAAMLATSYDVRNDANNNNDNNNNDNEPEYEDDDDDVF